MYNKKAVELGISQMKFKLHQNKSTICTVGGMIALGAAVVAAGIAGYRYNEKILKYANDLEEVSGEEVPRVEVAKTWGKVAVDTVVHFAVPGALAVCGGALVWYGHELDQTRIHELAATVTTLSAALAKARENADNCEHEHTHTAKGEDGREYTAPGEENPYERVLGPGNPTWNDHMEQCRSYVSGTLEYYQDKLEGKGVVFLNEIYRDLGFPEIPDGQVMGWSLSHPNSNGRLNVTLCRAEDIYDEAGACYGTFYLIPEVDGLVYNYL